MTKQTNLKTPTASRVGSGSLASKVSRHKLKNSQTFCLFDQIACPHPLCDKLDAMVSTIDALQCIRMKYNNNLQDVYIITYLHYSLLLSIFNAGS